MKSLSSFSVLIILLLSILLCVVESMLNVQGKEVSAYAQRTWDIVFLIFTMLWVYYDSERKDFDRPFDFGLFIYVFCPIVLPWYLVKSRGIEGMILLVGFIGLWLAP